MASSSEQMKAPAGRKVKMEKEFKAGEGFNYDGELTESEENRIRMFHHAEKNEKQTQGVLYKEIDVPADSVWHFVRRFDHPQAYKEFITECTMVLGDGCRPGNVRHIIVKPELPGKDSLEELVTLDDENRVLCFRILNGEHKLSGYKATTSIADRKLTNGESGSLLIESYVVDVPVNHTDQDTNTLVHTLVRANLLNLEKVARAYHENRKNV